MYYTIFLNVCNVVCIIHFYEYCCASAGFYVMCHILVCLSFGCLRSLVCVVLICGLFVFASLYKHLYKRRGSRCINFLSLLYRRNIFCTLQLRKKKNSQTKKEKFTTYFSTRGRYRTKLSPCVNVYSPLCTSVKCQSIFSQSLVDNLLWRQ